MKNFNVLVFATVICGTLAKTVLEEPNNAQNTDSFSQVLPENHKLTKRFIDKFRLDTLSPGPRQNHMIAKRFIDKGLDTLSPTPRQNHMIAKRFTDETEVDSHRIAKRLVDGTELDRLLMGKRQGRKYTRSKRSEEDCEKLRLCRLHASSRRNFVSAFELYFVNKENAKLWDHSSRSRSQCNEHFNRCYQDDDY